MSRCLLMAFVLLFGAVLPASGLPAAPGSLDGDQRLEAVVSVQAEGIAVGELVERVRRATGVDLTADPQAAEEKVVVFSRSRPLRDTLADLAVLLDHRWARIRSGDQVRYRLVPQLGTRQREAQLRQAVARRLAERMEEQVRALQETPEQLAQRGERDPIRRLLESPETRLGPELYAELAPEQKELLFLRQRLNFPFRTLAPRLQDSLRAAFTERLRLFEGYLDTQPELRERLKKAPPGRRSELLVDRAEDLERGSLRLRVRRAGGVIIVGAGLGILPFTVDVTHEEGRSSLASSLGFWPVGIIDGGDTWVLPRHGGPYTEDPVAPAADLPTVDTPTAGEPWVDQLRKVAERSGRPVFSDFYRSKPLTQPGSLGVEATDPATRSLDAFCRPAGYLWWTHGRSLLFRKRDWFEQRRYEVPDRWLAATAAALSFRAERPLRSDALLAAELTGAQLAGLQSLTEGQFTHDEDAVTGLPELLALLKAAPATDRPLPEAAALRQPGLRADVTVANLTTRQQALFRTFLETRDHPTSPDDATSFRASLAYVAEPATATPKIVSVRVRVDWELGTEVARPFTITVPLAIPNDRRDRTRVELR